MGDHFDLSVQQVHDRLILSDVLSDRSRRKTWASALTLQEFQGINFPGPDYKGNSHRFSYPHGEASGVYRNTNIARNDPYKTWETNARQVMQWTYDYLLRLSNQIPGFGDLFPVKPRLDGGCDQRYHTSHAELKLLTRLMRQGDAPFRARVMMSISRRSPISPVMANGRLASSRHERRAKGHVTVSTSLSTPYSLQTVPTRKFQDVLKIQTASIAVDGTK